MITWQNPRSDTKTRLRRAREALLFAYFGAIVAGLLTTVMGGHAQYEMIQLFGAVDSLMIASTFNLI